MKKDFVRGTWQKTRAFSPAVITQGAGRTIWLAGHTGAKDDTGKALAGDFDAQCRQTFRNIEKTLAEARCTLKEMVTMTVFVIDARYTTRMTELRTEIFGGDFPASAAITTARMTRARPSRGSRSCERSGPSCSASLHTPRTCWMTRWPRLLTPP